jgi:hypothetical protein
MPRVSTFYGVVIYMYWNERDHPVAHFHAYHSGRRASVSADGDVLTGSLESNPGRCSLSGNGLRSGMMRSWRTGNGHGGMSPCSASTRWRKMKIVDENYLPVVVGVAVVGDHVLRLLFSDGTAGDVDFSGERWTGVLSPLNDPAYFAEVTVDPEAGTIVWPGGIDLAPEPLYKQAKAHPLLAA